MLTLVHFQGRGVPTLDSPPSLPPSPSLDEVILATEPWAYWRLDPGEGNSLADRMANAPLSVAAGGPIAVAGKTIADTDSGGCMFFNAGATGDRLYIPDNVTWDTPPFTVLVHAALNRVDGQQILFVRESGAGAGALAMEVRAGGVPRFFYRQSGGGLIELLGSTEDITVGQSFAMLLTVGADTLYGRYKVSGGSLTTLSASCTPGVSSLGAAVSIGAYYNMAAASRGVISRAAWWTRALSEGEADDVMLPDDVTIATSINASSVVGGETLDVPVLQGAIYQGTPTVTIEAQPSDSTLSVVSSQVRITAGSTSGADSGTFAVDGVEAQVTFAVDVVSQGAAQDWVGSSGWGATAGNSTGVGRYSTFKTYAYRTTAWLGGDMDRLRFNLPRRPSYHGTTGGIMRVTIRDDNSGSPDMTGGGIVWQSDQFPLPVDGSGKIIGADGLTWFYGFGGDEGAEIVIDADLTEGSVYHICFTNEHVSPGSHWYSINNAFNESWLTWPYHPIDDFQSIRALVGNSSNVFTPASSVDRWFPYFQIRRDDGEWWGQPYFDCGSTSNIMALDGSGTKSGNSREIGGNWQLRQRWTHTRPEVTVNRWRGRVWRRTTSTANPLYVYIEREESGGGVTTLATIMIAAGNFFQTSYDNQSGQRFDPIDVPTGVDITFEEGETYRVRLSTGSTTRYAMRAPNGYSGSYMNVGRGGWQGRGEYSINGGSTWTGMHMYFTDNRDDCDWSMMLYYV